MPKVTDLNADVPVIGLEVFVALPREDYYSLEVQNRVGTITASTRTEYTIRYPDGATTEVLGE